MKLSIRGKRWILSVVAIMSILAGLLYLAIKPGIQEVAVIPEVFQEQNIQYEYENGFTFIISEQEYVNNPITHDTEALYVLNGATDEFRKFHIDNIAGELVISQNIMSPKARSKPYFQVVKVPNNKYMAIVHEGKVKVRIQYMYLGEQSTLLEYDLKTKKTSLVSHTLVGK